MVSITPSSSSATSAWVSCSSPGCGRSPSRRWYGSRRAGTDLHASLRATANRDRSSRAPASAVLDHRQCLADAAMRWQTRCSEASARPPGPAAAASSWPTSRTARLMQPDVGSGGQLVAEADEDARAARRRAPQQQLIDQRQHVVGPGIDAVETGGIVDGGVAALDDGCDARAQHVREPVGCGIPLCQTGYRIVSASATCCRM